ncbi:hypothetical protein R3P93_23160 [Rhodococcus cerastii]|uniref:Integral membrane protein n=1 Tax=Rhodococcus cerastii TaxID=908616 RepID=A0ABU4D6X2_9NOCA|nr:hypothetical protein [Rhodococcus cerastii]MDV6305475.1 hypothetical protein [Rhodococcus cerastii]
MGWEQIFESSIPLVVGLFSGWVASRAARKTPHEKLKALIEIQAALGPSADPSGTIEKSIELELKRLERSTVSVDSTWLQIVWARFLNNPAAVIVGCGLVLYSALFVVALNRFGGSMGGGGTTDANDSSYVWVFVGLVLAATSVVAATYASYRRDRRALLRD